MLTELRSLLLRTRKGRDLQAEGPADAGHVV